MPKAHITFIRGARTRPPAGYRYFCTATSNGSRHWSMVIESPPSEGRWDWEFNADVRWLVPAVPVPLTPGVEVELWEGRLLVAKAVILDG